MSVIASFRQARIGEAYASKHSILFGLQELFENCPVGELAQYDAEYLERMARTIRIRLAEETVVTDRGQ